MVLVNIKSPMPQRACITFWAWPGYSFRIDTISRLWKAPSAGIFMSTISGKAIWRIGSMIRSAALPMKKSSVGGRPTIVVG